MLNKWIGFILFLQLGVHADPVPVKIYNILVSSKKNLAPSHAGPVYEPVLRPYHPILYHTFPYGLYHQPATVIAQNIPGNLDVKISPSNIYPHQTPRQIDSERKFETEENDERQDSIKNETPDQFQAANLPNYGDPKQVIANLRPKTDVPDVPPPELPVKSYRKQ